MPVSSAGVLPLTGERDLAGEQEPGRGAGGRGTGERDLAGEQEPGRGAGDGEQENGIWQENK